MDIPADIGRYRILQEIGRGAMGVVYLGHDPKIDRRVAIKTVHRLDALPSEEAAEVRLRFTREAQAAGRLQHPGIVTIFDVGEHQDGYFIAMEYIEGDTLETHTRKDSLLPPASVVDLIAQACDALDYAHQHQVVHRDIKPANLMLVKGSRLKITDFGLAKNPATSLTQEGILIGTPNYMSPEQVLGRPLDGRADLFSLGAVLYELLTGVRPFAGESVTTIMYRIVHETPRAPRELRSDLPAGLGQVLVRALEKDPAQRFQSGAAFARALQQRAAQSGLAAAAVTARPTGETARRPRIPEPLTAGANWRTRARGTIILVGALGAVVLAPGVGTRDDRWGRGDAGGRPPFYATAALMSPHGSAAPPEDPGPGADAPAAPRLAAVALPGPGEGVVVTVQTTPPGGRVWLDDVEAPGGVLHLPPGDRATHTIVVENECYIEKVRYRAKGTGPGETLTVPLETHKSARVPVTSTPAGARIFLDGRDTGRTTPAELTMRQCGGQRVSLRKAGYREASAAVADRPIPVDLALERIPEGWITIGAAYPVEVLEQGRRVGEAEAPIRLTGGRHTLTLRNEALFVEETFTVTVEAGGRTIERPRLPDLGRLTVLASPSNCRIFVNGRDLGPPPINDHRLAAGTYAIRAVYVPTGEAKEATVSVTAGAGARVPFKFNP